MPSRQHNKKTKRVPRGLSARRMMTTGQCLLVQTSTGTTLSNSYNSNQFGYPGSGASNIVSTQILSDQNTYNVRIKKLTVTWLPSAGRSATAGFGQGAAVLTHTSLPPGSINPGTIAEYPEWKPFFVGKLAKWTWTPRTVSDRVAVQGASQYLFATNDGGGFTFVFSTSCSPTTVIGTLQFVFLLEVSV
jgi:hypothetical protein